MPRHTFGHHVGQTLFPVCSTGKTVHLWGRSLAGLKRGTDQFVSHPKEVGVCLGIETKHHQFQYFTTPNPSLLCQVAQFLHRYYPTPDLFIHLIKILLPVSLPKNGFIVVYSLALQRQTAFSSPAWSRSWVVVQKPFQKATNALCVCVQVLKQIMKK